MDPTFPQMPTESSLAQLQPFFPTYSFRKKATALHIDLALTVHPPSMVLRHSQKSGFAASLANRGSCSFLASFPCDVKTAGIQKCKFFWLSWSSKETNVFSEITEEGWKNRSQEENFWERWKLKRRIGRSQLALLSEDQGCIWRDKRGSNHTL